MPESNTRAEKTSVNPPSPPSELMQDFDRSQDLASVQDQYAPGSICFGCGPVNNQGLKIKTRPAIGVPGVYVASFRAESHHEAFPGMINGGIIGALLDCHSNWTAAMVLMDRSGATEPPCTVTADFHVKLRAPTPKEAELRLLARAKEVGDDRALIEAELWAFGDDGSRKKTATCTGTFVAVKPGHPAYHRWG